MRVLLYTFIIVDKLKLRLISKEPSLLYLVSRAFCFIISIETLPYNNNIKALSRPEAPEPRVFLHFYKATTVALTGADYKDFKWHIAIQNDFGDKMMLY